jgi:uncharacterized protein YbaR (Trm112 family)
MTEAPLPADALFVIACPACRGELSALASCAGRTACCPLCTATFVLPAQRLDEEGQERRGAVAAAVEPRRGTEEVRRSRRARRNLVFLLAGAAVLVGIVFVFAARARR